MRKWKEEDEGGHENSERWLLTYSDLITLLLALFIMLYAMSSVDTAKFQAIAEQLGIVLGGDTSAITEMSGGGMGEGFTVSSAQPTFAMGNGKEDNVGDGEQPGTTASKSVEEQLNELIAASGISGTVSVHVEERGVVVRLEEGLLFPSGSATINTIAKDTLSKIAGIIKSTDNFIRVEGSTDNVPIKNNEFRSNWELASQRAINVTESLIEGGVSPSRISVTSYGEYRPVAENDMEENKKMNRRVDIVFLNKDLNASEASVIPSETAQP